MTVRRLQASEITPPHAERRSVLSLTLTDGHRRKCDITAYFARSAFWKEAQIADGSPVLQGIHVFVNRIPEDGLPGL